MFKNRELVEMTVRDMDRRAKVRIRMGQEWRQTATNLSLQGLMRDLQRLELGQDLREQRIIDEDLVRCRHCVWG